MVRVHADCSYLEERAQAFPLHEVIAKYAEHFSVPLETAELHMRELKTYLVSRVLDYSSSPPPSPELKNLLETLLSSGKIYNAFCKEALGTIVDCNL